LQGGDLRQESPLHGLWRNPVGTVEVRIDSCGATLCGNVVAASPSAIADARDSGYPSLVGMQILRDYRASGSARWQGTIFVPDMGRDFSSHIEMVDANHVLVSGCLFGKFLCKSQLWRRV
jgi:uncharacterized protein (DUF2147 family)